MAEDQVVLVEHRGGRLALAGVVGVVEAGHAFDFAHIPAEQHRQPAQQIDAGDHAAGADAEALVECRHVRRVALAPEPDLRRGVQPGLAADFVDLVLREQLCASDP